MGSVEGLGLRGSTRIRLFWTVFAGRANIGAPIIRIGFL